jgi:PAS domain S-box-containing protein
MKKEQKQKIAKVFSTKSKTEKEKKLSQQSCEGLDFYRAFFEYAPDAFYVYDLQGRLLEGNKAAEKLTGFTKKEFSGKNFYELGLVDKRYLPLLQASLKKNNQGKATGPEEIEITAKNGKKVYVTVKDFPINVGGEKLVLGIAHDITEKKQAEQQLIGSEKRYRNLLDNLMEGGQLISRDFRYLYINDVAAKHGRKTKKQLLGKTMMELYPNIEKTQMFAMIKKCFKQKSLIKMENEFIFPDGKKGLFELRIEPTEEGVFILSNDITESKKVENLLLLSEEKFRKAFETSPDSVAITRAKDGKFLTVNQGFENLSGYSKAETIGKTSLDLNIWVDLKDRQRIVDQLRDEGSVQNFEAVFRRKNNTVFKGMMSAAIIELEGEPHILNITRDISERFLAEEKLARSEERYRKIFESSPEMILLIYG